MSEQDNMTEQDIVMWYEHGDAYVTLLESVCVGTDRSMGCTFSDKFWWQFTRRLIRECTLDIAVTEAVVNSRQKFGEFLKRMHKDFEVSRGPVVLENIWAEAPIPGLEVASIVTSVGTGLEIARQGTGRTNVIDVER
ncbi:hypothetical protein OROMI_015358 [Orobanche minor]